MATTDVGGVFKVSGESGAYAWGGGTDEEWRFVPASTGMGTLLQGLGWPLVYITSAARDAFIANFGQGADFT